MILLLIFLVHPETRPLYYTVCCTPLPLLYSVICYSTSSLLLRSHCCSRSRSSLTTGVLTHTALVEILRSQKDQTHFYWGTTWRGDEEDRWPKEMWGSGYILSWDLVSWISTSPIPADNADGFEDYQVCAWLIEGTPRESRLHTIPVCTIPSCPE